MRIALQIGFLLAVAASACTATEADTLLGGNGSRAGASSGSGSSGGPTGSTLGTGSGSGGGDGTSSGASSGGGTTSLDGGFAALGDGGSGARAMFEALLPSFDTACGGACHQQGGSNAPAYLGGADPYATIKGYPGFVVPNAQQSVLLTKGAHEGPAIADPLKTSILNWLTAEGATAAAGPVQTNPITVTAGPNTVDLSKVGVAGASLTFTAAIAGDVLTLSALSITAPAATGIHVTFPIFYVNTASGGRTENDDLSNDDQTIAAGKSAILDTGLLLLSGWAPTDTLQVGFSKLASATAMDAGVTGGCKNVASFITNAVPAIQANTCLNCHNTGGSGNASLDLSGLASNPVDDAAACAQALTRVNTTTPAQSDIILAPTGGVANHPFKGASASYVTMMETWIQAEK